MSERKERGMGRGKYERAGRKEGKRKTTTAGGGGGGREGESWYIAVIHFRAFKCCPYFPSDKKIEIIQPGPYLRVGAECV